MESFSEYLETYEKNLTTLAKKPSQISEKVSVSKQVRKEPVKPSVKPVSVVKKPVNESKNTMTICTSCGWHINVLLENCAYCPKCSKVSLKFINESSNVSKNVTNNKSNPTDYATDILDDNSTDRPSLLENYLKKQPQSPMTQLLNSQRPAQQYSQAPVVSEMSDHASDLLDGLPDVNMKFIPMPDFSQFEKKHLQMETAKPAVDIPPELHIVPPQQIDVETQRQMEAMGLL